MIGVTSPVVLLAVEDNPGDIRLLEEALRTSRLRNELVVARDGVEALAMLHREAPFSEARLPHLILLDLNLPRKDGRQVLRELKADHRLRSIPVVILSTSRAEEDVRSAYDGHASCYVVKPVDFADLQRVIQEIEGFWFSIVTLPSRPEEAEGG